MNRFSLLVRGLFKQLSTKIQRPAEDDQKPQVETMTDPWDRENGFRIAVYSVHQGFNIGSMYTVEHARHLARELNAACDEVERKDFEAQQP